MNDKAILEMIKDIVEEVDYDMAKAIFDDDCSEDLEESKLMRKTLIKIAKKHLPPKL